MGMNIRLKAMKHLLLLFEIADVYILRLASKFPGIAMLMVKKMITIVGSAIQFGCNSPCSPGHNSTIAASAWICIGEAHGQWKIHRCCKVLGAGAGAGKNRTATPATQKSQLSQRSTRGITKGSLSRNSPTLVGLTLQSDVFVEVNSNERSQHPASFFPVRK